MSQAARFVYVLFGYTGVGIVALLYAQAGQPLLERVNGTNSGPFTDIAMKLDTVIPLILAMMALGLTAYLIIGPVQEEKARRRRRP